MEDPNTDEWLSKVDIEKIVKEAEESTKYVDPEVSKDFNHFASPMKPDTMQEFKTCMFSASTRKKANWAGCIFEQWKCIRNYKLKQTDHLDDVIDGNLLTLKIDQLSDILSSFLMEICKQNGEEYPCKTLYKIVLSIQYYMCINGRDIKLLDYLGLVKMRNTLDNRMKQLLKKGVVQEWQ